MTEDLVADIIGRSERDRPALLGEQSLSYSQLKFLAESIAAQLVAADPAGRLVASALPHGAASVAVLLAARMTGRVFVPVNPKSSSSERRHILEDSQASLLVVSLGDRAAPEPTVESTLHAAIGIQLHRYEPRQVLSFEPNDAFVIYTSGSTGLPKGVVLTSNAVRSNVSAVSDYLALSATDRLAAFTPPSFGYAINQVLSHLWVGAAILPWPAGVMQPLDLLRAHHEFALTGVQANPGIISVLANIGKDAGLSLPAVRYVQSGGQPLTTTLVKQIEPVWPNARIVNMYGCTENGPRVSYKWLPPESRSREKAWPVGKPIDGTELAILDQAGELLGAGVAGEVAIRGASRMRTYLGREDLLAERLSGDWFRTRDLGFIDANGDLHLLGRVDNVILVGQEKVSAEEVEDAIAQVDGVQDVAVGAISDPTHYQVVGALLAVGEHDQTEVLARVKRHMRTKLSRSKAPREYFFVDAVPRTAYGKIDRRGVASVLAKLSAESADTTT